MTDVEKQAALEMPPNGDWPWKTVLLEVVRVLPDEVLREAGIERLPIRHDDKACVWHPQWVSAQQEADSLHAQLATTQQELEHWRSVHAKVALPDENVRRERDALRTVEADLRAQLASMTERCERECDQVREEMAKEIGRLMDIRAGEAADLVKAQADLTASREECERLRLELEETEFKREENHRMLNEARAALEQTRERMRALEDAARDVVGAHEDGDIRTLGDITEAKLLGLRAALPASQPTMPAAPAAQPPEQGASDGPVAHEHRYAFAVDDNGNALIGIAGLRELLDAVERDAKLKAPSPPAPSPAVEGPSVRSPLPWALDNSAEGDVVDSAGALVSECQEPDDARFIVALANQWHEQLGRQ